jgi:hypothetical protein
MAFCPLDMGMFMRAELPNQSAGRSCVREALAEIRAGHGDLQTHILGMFDRLDGLADQLLGSKAARDCAAGQADQDALQGQIDRLASLAAELAQSVADQKRMTTPESQRQGS